MNAAVHPHAFSDAHDQAAGLRSLLKRRALRLLPVLPAGDALAQGAAAALLARELAASGRRVILLDETGAAARPLGAQPRHDLLALIQGEQEFPGVALRINAGLRYVAAAEGLAALIGAEAAGEPFFTGFLNLSEPADTIVLNLAGTAAPSGALWLPDFGSSTDNLMLVGTADRDLTAAYAAIKQAASGAALAPAFRLLVNGAPGERAARAIAAKIAEAARRFLDVQAEYAGNLPPTAAGLPLGRTPATQAHPRLALAMKQLAQAAQAWRLAECTADEPEFSHQN